MTKLVNRDVNAIFEDYVRNSTAMGMASIKTWDVYKRGMGDFISYLVEYDKHVRYVDTCDIERFRRHLIDMGRKPRTIMVKLAAIRVLFRALIRAGYVDKDPTIGVKAPKVDVPTYEYIASKIIHPKVFALVLGQLGDSIKDRRDRVILLFMYALGLRVSEVAGLLVDNIGDKTIKFLAKGNKERTLPMPDMLVSAIDSYLEVYIGHSGHLFDICVRSIQKMVRARFAKIGYKINPHALRHSCATVSAINKASPYAIQDQLGHESQKTTSLYTKIAGRFMESPANIVCEALKCV